MHDELIAMFQAARLEINARSTEAEDSVKCFRAAASNAPELAEERTWLALGMATLRLDADEDTAAQDWALIAAGDAPRADTFCMLGLLAERRRDFVATLNWCEAAMCLSPRKTKYVLADLVEGLGDRYHNAIRCLQYGAPWVKHEVSAPDKPPPKRDPPWSGIHLLMDYYDSSARRAELHECLKLNCENPAIEAVWLFGVPVDLEKLTPHSKIHPVPTQGQSTFTRFFAFASHALPDKLVCVANSDIYFDETVKPLLELDLGSQVLTLTRWDITLEDRVFLYNPISHDAWIFVSPIEIPGANFHLGRSGCDSHLAYLLWKNGRRPWNPSLSIRANHLHMSQASNEHDWMYKHRVLPPHAKVEITKL